MNKKELVKAVAAKSGQSEKSVTATLDVILGTIKETMQKEESLTLIGFGAFAVKERAARQGFNPKTKESIEIPAQKVVKFKASKVLLP